MNIEKTKSTDKLWNYFLSICKTDYFQEWIKKTRKKYNIPDNGFEPIKACDGEGYSYRLDPKTKKICSAVNGYELPPPNWIFYAKPEEFKLKKVEIKEICIKYSLHFLYWGDAISFYLFYNRQERVDDVGYSMFLVSDIPEEKEEPIGAEIQNADDFAFPIAIRLSPYASQRDINDFIKKSYHSYIEPLQQKYRDKTLKIASFKRKKSEIQERNDFIFGHKHLPAREIMHLLYEKYGPNNKITDIDYAYIGKIISLEKKKRKEI